MFSGIGGLPKNVNKTIWFLPKTRGIWVSRLSDKFAAYLGESQALLGSGNIGFKIFAIFRQEPQFLRAGDPHQKTWFALDLQHKRVFPFIEDRKKVTFAKYSRLLGRNFNF